MSDPVTFDNTSPRFGLPLLYVGQSQKETFVNEALSRIDALLCCAVEGEAASPPAAPVDGSCWLLAGTPDGAWAGQASGAIACYQGGQWLFVPACDGMRLFNKGSGQDLRRVSGQWAAPASPALPSGGTTVDTEARAALAQLVQALVVAGLFPIS